MNSIFDIQPAKAVRPCVLPHGDGVIFSAVFQSGDDHGIQFIHIPDGEAFYIPLTDAYRVGRVYSVRVTPFQAEEWLYRYRSGGRWILDPMAFSVKKTMIQAEDDATPASTETTALLSEKAAEEGISPREKGVPAEGGSLGVEGAAAGAFVEIEACSCFPLRAASKALAPTDWRDEVVYGIHVKGLTAAKPEDFPGKGTFAGVSAMIPYLKELGVTAVELMPVYLPLPVRKNSSRQFKTMEEALRAWPVSPQGDPLRDMKERPNYWGYGRGFYYALRPEFGTQAQFARMVQDLHEAGLRVILQFHFTKGMHAAEQIEIIRFYLSRYGIDGFRLMGYIPSAAAIAEDPSLADTALFFDDFPFEALEEEAGEDEEVTEILGRSGADPVAVRQACLRDGQQASFLAPGMHAAGAFRNGLPGKNDAHVSSSAFQNQTVVGTQTEKGSAAPIPRPAIITCGDGFQTLLRRFVKSDDYVMKDFLRLFLSVPELSRSALRHAAVYEGFTLADLVSYNERHNEENGEFGLDGIAENHSWNCGEEGDISNPEILALRRKQIRNFLTLLFLSQGTPLLWQGDERMNSQGGNNNPYCQDNAVSWVDWTDSEEKKALTAFTTRLAAFKREHPVFRSKKPFQYIDYLGIGHPDVSLHGAKPWMPDLGPTSHSIGISFCENYAQEAQPGQVTTCEPGVPVFRYRGQKKLPAFTYLAINMYWEELSFALPKLPVHCCWKVCFDTEEEDGFLAAPAKIPDQHFVAVAPRSIRILRAFPDADAIAKDREKERRESLPPAGAIRRYLRTGQKKNGRAGLDSEPKTLKNGSGDPAASPGGLKKVPGTARLLREAKKTLPPKYRGRKSY